jgi:type III pantothenate kinase
MLLGIDLGNTNLKLGLFAERTLLHQFRLETRREASATEYAAALRDQLERDGFTGGPIDAAVIASVVPVLTPVIRDAVQLAFGAASLIVTSELELGIALSVDSPAAVGVDRWLNLVLLRERALTEAGADRGDAVLDHGYIAVDFGTATTLDCLSPAGEFVGGVIAPGARVCLDALVARTAQLPPVELMAPARVVGRNTVEAMQSGIVHGYASLIDGLLDKARAELGFPCRVVATGGLAPLIGQHTRSLTRVEPHLTLYALDAVYARNAKRFASS